MDVPLSLNLKFDDSLKHILIPSLITQTFVENCFVHGFATQNTPASINIDVTKQEKELQIRITDNGTATINKSKNENHISRSNQIVEQRIKNTYPKSTLPKDFLTYGIKNNEYQVVIKLPITT
jgi:LytS/YehU family sensor histidine kinase